MAKKNYFVGEHATDYGSEWGAMSEDKEGFIKEAIGRALYKGEPLTLVEIGGVKYLVMQYKECAPIFFMAIVEIKEGNEPHEFLSCYPAFEGADNEVILKDTFAWDVLAEGEMACELVHKPAYRESPILNFHNPHFAADICDFKKNNTQTIALAGLAYSIFQLEEQDIEVTEGPFYNFALKKFLEENPDKSEQDFEAPVVSLSADSFRRFEATEYTSDYSASGQVKEVHHADVVTEKITILKVDFGHEEDDEPLLCNVYVNDKKLKGYAPKVGDGVNVSMWLTGYFK